MTKTLIRFLVITSLLISAGNAAARDQRNTSCLKEKFNLVSVVDLDMPQFKGASELLEQGDTVSAEESIRSYFMGKSLSPSLSGLGKCQEAVERADGILTNKYRFWTYDEYKLPEDLQWNENPVNSRTWTYYLLSFEFLWILNEAYRETGNLAYLEKARLLIEDFARDSLNPKSLPHQNIWYDHPAANRLVYLVDYWFLYHSSCKASPEFTSLMLELLWRHARFVKTTDNYNAKTNHGLFNCLALERLAFAFPEMAESDEFLEFSLARYKKQLEDNFDKDGVHKEYSPWYQIWIAGLLMVYTEDCQRNGVQLPGACIISTEKIVRVCGNFFHPDWTVALFGDSDLYLNEKMMDLVMESSPCLNFIWTRSSRGRRPAYGSVGLTDSNIYIMRSGWGRNRSCEDESCLMAFYTDKAHNHDHEDLMGFELYSRGVKWITDLGRYNYNYMTEERKYIVSQEAHNGILPFRFVTPAESKAERTPVTPGSRNRPKNEGHSTKRVSGSIYRGDLESEINRISKETDPQKRADSCTELLERAQGDDKIRIKFMLAFVLAEELGENEAAAVQLNEIIRDSTDDEQIALARQYLALMERSQNESIKNDDSSSKEVFPPSVNIDSNRRKVAEARTVLKEVRAPSGKGPKVFAWISNPRFDYLEGSIRYERGFLHHSRAILFIKPYYFLIVDRFSSKQKIQLKQLFHFPPDVSVINNEGFGYILGSSNGKHCLMKGIENSFTGTEIIKGKTEPGYQGWYSGIFENFVPASVLQNQLTFFNEAYVIYLFVPTGQRNPASFDILVHENGLSKFSDDSSRQLRLEIVAPRQKIKIKYTPTKKFLDNLAPEVGSPQISIRKARR